MSEQIDRRDELLLKMYDQLFNDINRHIMVIWQSVSTIIGAFAIFALVEKDIIPIDVASGIIIVLIVWLIAHLYDAAYWYNRNLVIIANIERQFLKVSDLKDIHYYFGKHRPNNVMLTHLKIQYALGVGLLLIVVLYHLSLRVIPGLTEPLTSFELIRATPYIILILSFFYLRYIRQKRKKAYSEFIENSPGQDVNVASQDLKYGVGHGFKETNN
ncbi:MAG: hypothetical protein A2Y03_00545 [Omnitrophica WOR_2 bacterium GWF2_38_59]|nr:MAG: hypothetical protein A2Y03_00545 [Omnitrophica WOR_2 bacterium GWF2_38_59]OGX49534.1 MAG: hypothetical protein A2243_10660 [Omnitrophica WOR_2 bacterium RIFOXYA2_FULL_38_17]OGX58730.1 MAG: hypothetical protein A2306_12285 [Omnitrophica WOR_2 bacterium RIFOXYB2_FULL_38_16]HBG62161.1 hypothetical protein [Candidatus Omnitrophota bacterium]